MKTDVETKHSALDVN